MMELFDKKFVHFMWDDELKGKRGFLSSGIDALIKMVNEDSDRTEIQKGCERDLPFCKHITVECRLAYYDPNYEAKKAFNEGKQIQHRLRGSRGDWIDTATPTWSNVNEYRAKPEKPEEKKWVAYLARAPFKGASCHLTACREDAWETAQEEFAAKTKLFVGTEGKLVEWYKPRQKFAKVIKAWEDGKRIQVTPKGTDKWVDLHCEPTWDIELEYRVKPECPCADGIDSKACVGCEHSEDGKPHPFENYHCYVCDKSDEQYRSYSNSAEMIADFTDRFKAKCPPYAEPLIWLSLKEDKRNRFLVTGFHEDSIEITKQPVPMDMSCVFEKFVYLDGSPCGMEVKK